MNPLIIACLSQKGGVGKSTLARLIAWTYAHAEWQVKICDFNTKQLTSVDWVSYRMAQQLEPTIAAEPYNSVKNFRREPFDLLVVDGRPDSDQSSLDIARLATLNVIPTGLALDDLKPQLMFANELREKGVPRERILIVLNKITESATAVQEARSYLSTSGFAVAESELAAKTGYQIAQNSGRSIAETTFMSLNDRAISLASEIADQVTSVREAA